MARRRFELRDGDTDGSGLAQRLPRQGVPIDMANPPHRDEPLQQSEERFRLLVESVKDYAIFMLDPEGCVLTWNAGAELIKGYTAAEIVGEHFSRFYPPEARDFPAHELQVAAAEGRFEDEGWRVGTRSCSDSRKSRAT